MVLRSVVFALVVLCATQAPALAQKPGRGADAPSPPRGSFLGMHAGLLLPSDRAAIGFDGGGSKRIDAILRATPEREEAVEAVLGGPFTIEGEPTDSSFDPAFTFGFAAGYAFHPGWEGQIDIASYRAEASSSLPMSVDTGGGPQTATGRLSTDIRGLLVDALLRRSWTTGLYRPQIGAGLRVHRMSPEDTALEIEQSAILVDPAGSQTDLSPLAEFGLARAIGGKVRVGVAGVIAGRSLPDEDGNESWVVEPEFRLWGNIQLGSEEGDPTPPHRVRGASDLERGRVAAAR